MAAIESPEKVGIKSFGEFDEANGLWPRGRRPAAIREAAGTFRERFARPDNVVHAVRTIDLASAAYPVKFAFGGAVPSVNPYLNIVNRLIVVQYQDFDGRLRTFLWEPTVAEGPAEAPFYAQMIKRYGEFVAYKVIAREWHTVPTALASVGLRPEDVDFFGFDHLHVQDPRLVLGTRDPIDGETVPRPPLLGDAKMLAQRREVDTFESLHPMQWAWYVEPGMQDVIDENVVLLDGDVELGKGLAIVSTPGHTDGNQSLVINTPGGVWVSSENGVAADNWHPHLSKIPGVRRFAEFFNREVVLNSNTLEDSIDQYDSMLKERALADAHAEDPRFLNVLPSSELPAWRRQWPVLPTFHYGGINCGTIETRAATNGHA